jgi:hypothetical protein
MRSVSVQQLYLTSFIVSVVNLGYIFHSSTTPRSSPWLFRPLDSLHQSLLLRLPRIQFNRCLLVVFFVSMVVASVYSAKQGVTSLVLCLLAAVRFCRSYYWSVESRRTGTLSLYYDQYDREECNPFSTCYFRRSTKYAVSS